MQWNCRGFRANWEELSDLIARCSPVCLCIQETLFGDVIQPVLLVIKHFILTLYMISDIMVEPLS